MTDLEARIEALERALTEDQGDLSALVEGGDLAERLETVETELEALRADVDDVQAATQALRGYVGNVRAVNEEVEQRAETALATVESLEDRIQATSSADSDATAAPDEACHACGQRQPTADETRRRTRKSQSPQLSQNGGGTGRDRQRVAGDRSTESVQATHGVNRAEADGGFETEMAVADEAVPGEGRSGGVDSRGVDPGNVDPGAVEPGEGVMARIRDLL